MRKFFTPFTSMVKFFALMGLLALPQLIFAQGIIWKNLANDPITPGKRYIIPQKYQVVQLDIPKLKSLLNRAPMEYTSAARNSDVILELPMPDGSIQRFRVVESPIMEEGLAKKFPQIKTYAGSSLDKLATTVRFDLTPAGFHAMVLSPEGTFFVDPYSNGTTEYYISYAKKDFVSNKVFSCDVDSEGLPTIDTHDKHRTIDQDHPTPLDYSASTDVGNRFGDCVLRTYRLALAATGEYTAFHGGTVAGALAAQVTSMNRVNGVYIQDLSVKMILVANNNLIIYTNSATDPYSNSNGSAMLAENQTNLDAVIGTANYDVGHVYSTGGGGVATLRSPCSSTTKARGVTGQGSPVGDPFDIDYVAHEMGHQFGGNHTFNNSCGGNRNSTTAWEPGSGTTIMGYAGICPPDIQSNSDAYFHGGSLAEMHNFVTGSGNTCATKPTYTNAFPSITSSTASQTIPKGTPILLSGNATDADGNASITYCWEQMNTEISTQAPVSTATGGPNFRSRNPTLSNTRYLPRINDLATNAATTWEVLPTVARTLSFRLVVRDNAVGGGCNDHVDMTLTVDGNSGPLVVNIPSATGISWAGSSTQTVTWNVANTDVAPVNCTTVDILLSTDGGLTYPTTLATNVTNSGTASITVPNVATTTARIMVRGSGKAFFDISNNNFTITTSTCTAPSAPVVGTITQPTCAVPTGSVVLSGLPATGTWTLTGSPGAVTSTGTGTSTTISGLAAGTYTYTVTNAEGCTSVASANIVINPVSGAPTAPTVGTITQPTCAVATGSVVLNGLPASGTWTLTRSPGAVTSTGTGTSITISSLAAGTYTYTVTNAAGCTSTASGNVVINTQPATPTAPSVGTITQPTCAVATGSVVLSGLPATGTWTLTRSPGAVTSTGTGTSTTISGLAAGTYTYTVTNAAGCTSTASGNIVINTQPATPTAPSVGTITQPTCSVATGSVVLNGLPASGTWTLTRSPGAVTSTGTGTSITISVLAAGTYTYTVTNAAGCTSTASGNVVIDGSSTPAAPSVGTITQPTCAVATGSVVLSGLLASGTWTLTRSPGAVTSTGTGTSTTISGLAAGTYTYTVTNAAGCVSVSSNNIVINTQPSTPTAPSVGTITQPTCPTPTGSVVLSGLPASGTWTLTRNPGAVTSTGTGTSTTISGIPAGTFTYTVTNAAGCTSTSSSSIVINAAQGCCTQPVIVSVNTTVATCDNGTIVISATGSSALEYSINDGANYQTSEIFSGLSASSNYRVKVRYQNSAFCSLVTTWASNPVSVQSGVNLSPTVTLTSPTTGATFASNTTLTATASDPDGSISQVNFYVAKAGSRAGTYLGFQLVGSDNTEPYSVNWNNASGGNYIIKAEAIDNCGQIAVHSTTTVYVLETFTVVITSPSLRQEVGAGTGYNIAASVVRFTSRTVSKVEFFANDVKLGEDATAPYNYQWNNIPVGTHIITAKATDNLGAVWTSQQVFIIADGTIPTRTNSNRVNNSSMFNVSPNPSNNQVSLNSNIYAEGEYLISITDITGKVVLAKTSNYVKGENSENLNIASLPKGIYIVRLAQSQGSEFLVQKLVVD